MDADVLEPSRLPRSTTREPATYELLSEHDILVMLDVSASGLAWAQQDDIARWISEAGGGMLVVGGENAFAPGGYLGSRLEEAMPLSTQLPRDKPKVSIVFVIDRSGSMQQESSEVTRLDVATRSTIAAVDLLDESSSVGIVAFDSEAILVRQLEPLQVGPSVEEALADLRPGGGTDLMPAMRLALDQLAEAPDGVQRHVVIMSDGLSRPGPLLQIAAEFADLGATVSTVAIGQGADFKLLTEIAQVGLGVPHLAPDARSLPAILAQEALLMSEELTELGLFQPAVATRPDWLSGVGSPLPPLHGRNPVDKKDDASLVLTTQQADPLLATWQYGLGRVAALASDGVGFWSRDWVSSPDAQRLFAQLTRWLLPTLDSGAGSTATPDQAHVFADLGSSGSAPDYPARLRPYPGTSAYLEGLTALTGGATNLSPAEIPQPRLEVIISRAWRPWAVLAFLTALAGFTLVRGARSQPVGRQL